MPLLSIVPQGSELEARLLIPTRAIGFIEPGQAVLLRYQAFPYQKFGQYREQVAHISRSTLSSSDLAVSAYSGRAGNEGAGPVYPVTVKLANQSANAYYRAVALQPGMELEADILVENRCLIEWVLEPLYTLTGNLRG